MDLEQRLNHLESHQDWQAVVDLLEQAIAGTADPVAKAGLHLRLGRVLTREFLNGTKALKHFQDAFKLNPALLEALDDARAIYWDLGKLPMVQKLLELALKHCADTQKAQALWMELGDVFTDEGDADRAMESYARALQNGAGAAAGDLLEDIQQSEETWQDRVGVLLRNAHAMDEPDIKGIFFVRAGRVARKFAPEAVEGMAGQAYGADPTNVFAAASYEQLLVDSGRSGDLLARQREIVGALAGAARAEASIRYGARWAQRHQNTDVAVEFLVDALRADPTRGAPFVFLEDLWGRKGGAWEQVVQFGDELLGTFGDSAVTAYLLAHLGLACWRELGDVQRARPYFDRLAQLQPAHPAVAAFQAQLGAAPAAAASAPPPPPAPPSVPPAPAPAPVSAPPSAPVEAASPPSGGRPSVRAPASGPVDEAGVAALREKVAQLEAAKRFNEYVKALVQLADAVANSDEKAELYLRAADLYVNKFANQAEAVKVYERVMEVDPSNTVASGYLRAAYEKRRDWEKLIHLGTLEADALGPGAGRAAAYKEIAKLATERVKKPEVCIGLWQVVVDEDGSDVEALDALAGLFERAREFEKLFDTLMRLADATYDTKQKIEIYTKLGQVAGDRLKDDERAVEAYRMLLTLQPDDRRAQEQLKKRYQALGRWDDLEVFYAEAGKWDEFIRILEQAEAKAETDASRVGMLMKIAELWMTQKGNFDRAAKAYEKVLSIDANHLGAAENLIPLYKNKNNYKGLASAVEVRLQHVDIPGERLELLREVAALYEEHTGEPERAFERYLAAFELAPADPRSQADADRAAALTGKWDALIASYRKAIATAEADSDFTTVTGLRLRLGRILVHEVNRVDDALAEYRAVYESEPENPDALSALEGLYRHTQRWAELLEVYTKKRDLADGFEERRGVLHEIARLYETQLADHPQAVQTYQTILDEDPADGVALEALDRLYSSTGQWEAYADVLRRRIELDVPQEVLADLKYRLAGVQAKHLGDEAGALENYREILFLSQDHEGARMALEGFLASETLRAEAAAILESIYEARGDWEKLITALEILATGDVPSERKVALLRKVAATASTQLSDPARALEAQARALEEDPALGDSRYELEQFAAAANAWDRVLAIYGKIAEGLTDAGLAREYWMRLASIHEQLGRVKDAAAGYEKVLALDPSDGEALAAMDALYRGHGHWEDLIGVFRRRIELAEDGAQREQLYSQMAAVFEEKLNKPEDAIAAYREVLALDPASQVALSALDGLFTRTQKWAELAENLETQLSLADTDVAQLDLMLRLAALRQTQMGDVEAAIEGFRAVLERDPSNAAALAALESLGQQPAHEVAIAEILEPLYRASGDFRKLIAVHEVQVRRAEDPARQVDLLHQVATLYEDAANDASAAFDTMARALAADPANELTQEALERLAALTGRYQDLAAVLERLAAEQQDAELGSRLFTSAARLLEASVGDGGRAIELYRRVLAGDPTNLAAAESLQGLFTASQRWADLSEILQRKAGMLDDVEAQKEALFQAAAIEEQTLQRPDSAIAVYQKVQEIDGEDLRSVDALINLFLGLKRWEELLGAFNKKADLVMSTDEKKQIYYQVGGVFESELKDAARAIEAYQRVLELDPDDMFALGRLDLLFFGQQNWPELLTVLTREAELTQNPLEAVGFQYRIADLYEKCLDDIDRAVDLYRDILNIQPDHAPTLAALEGIKAGERAPLAAASVLEPVYDAASDWAKLISVLEVQARFADDTFSRVDLLHRVARLYEDALSDSGSAFETYARAVAVDSANEDSLSNLERLAATTQRWPQVAALYDAELEKLTSEPERLVELGLRTAQVYEVQLESVDQAVARYRKVLEADVENQSAVRSLDRLFSHSERWIELVEVLGREAEIGQTPDEILEFKYRLGQVYQLRLNDIDKAIAAYSEVIAAAPEHAETLAALEGLFAAGIKQLQIGEILEPLYQSGADWEKLIRVREAQLAHVSDPDERIAMYHRIAEDAEERLMDPAMAFGVHVRALKERPLEERTGEEVERLAGMIDGGWDQLGNAYADALGIPGLPAATSAIIGKRLARVFEEELADVQRAEETYRYVLTVQPMDADALSNLDRIYSSLEQWAELAGVLEQRAVAAEDQREKVEFYSRLGQVYEERLGRLDDAIRAFNMIFGSLEPTNVDAIAALARLYEAKQAWNELNAVYQRQLENAVGDLEESEIRAKMAFLASERLGKVEEAVEGWKRVLDLRGEDAEALGALADLYDRQQQWSNLTEVLERQFDISDADEDRVAVLSRRARLFTERLGRDEEALETWHRVLDIEPSNLPGLRAVADIWRRRSDASELVAALHMTVDRAASLLEPAELVAIQRELGRTYGQVLQQPPEAADAWRRLLEVDPGDFEAMAALEAIYRAEDRWPEVVGVKLGRADALAEPAEKIRELLEVTDIWRVQANDYDKATLAFERVLAIDPTHDRAFNQLEKLHTAASRWEPLVELYLNRLETRETTVERCDILRRIAVVFDEKLGDQNQAFDALVNAFSEDYSDDQTVKLLEKVAQATGRWGELINTANSWLQEQTEDAIKIVLCLRLGKWYGEDLGHLEYAQPYFQQVLKLDPGNVQVLRRMAALHRKSANWQKMGETLTAALKIAGTNDDRKGILFDLGELLDKNMGQVDQGLPYYKQALDVDPHYLPALEAMEKIYEARGQTKELVETLGAKVPSLTSKATIAETKLRMGDIYEHKLGDFDAAAKVYREALAADEGNLEALQGLERVYQALKKWAELAEVLELQLDVVPSERERVAVLLRLASIQEEQFLKADLAAQRFEQAVSLDATELSAYTGLERCYRRLKQWPELISAYERHIEEVVDPTVKIELYGQMAAVYADEVDDVDHAIDAYRAMVELDATNVTALDALSKLYEKQGNAYEAIEAMTRVADLTTDGKQRVEAYYRIGKALDEKLSDRAQAQERFEMALDLDPAHLPSLAALRQIAVDEGDWDRAARYLDQEQTHTELPRTRAKLLVDLGKIREEQLGEHDLAIQAFQLAMQCDQDCEEAALPLVNEYVATEKWAEAEPLADLLAKKSRSRERSEQHSLHKLLGKVLAALGQNERALKAYQTAHQLDLTDQESIKGIAEVGFALKDWPTALSNYQKVLTALGEDEVEGRTEVYFRLGCIKREQGQAKQAINQFEKALALIPEHRPTLEALVGTYSSANDWKQVAAYKRQILDGVFEGDERYTLLVEIGDIWSDKEKNTAKAIEALEEARDLKPQNHVLLHKLLQLYQAAGEWQKMVDTIQAISDLESRPEFKARYLFTIAQVYRDKLEDADRSVELFNEALDLNPKYLEAFERINKILTTQKSWKGLERAYRKMIHRIAGKGETDLEYTLWHQLGLIYRDRLGQAEEAIESFKVAASLKPDEALNHQILSELFEANERWDEAIERQRVLLEQDPLKIEPYRALYRFYLHKQAFDEAWTLAAAMAFMKKADEEEQRFFEDYRPQGMLPVKGRLNNELWAKCLFHADENLYISKIFEMIAPAALRAKILQLQAQNKSPNLDKRFKQDPATSTVTLAKTFGWAAQVLGIATPELYIRNDIPGAMMAVPAMPPASIAGQSVLSGFQPPELVFLCGKHLTGYRPEHYIRNLFPTQAELTIMLFAGVMIAAPNTPMPQDGAQQIRATAQELAKHMEPVQIEGLRMVVKRFIEEGATGNIRKWSHGVDLTAARAGLLLCGDLDVAKKILAAEQGLPGDLSPAEKMKELLIFSVSERYSQLRKALGIAVS